MTPLRRKMIEEFQIRHYAAGTQRSYLHCVTRFAQHFGRSPVQTGKRPAGTGLAAPLNHHEVAGQLI